MEAANSFKLFVILAPIFTCLRAALFFAHIYLWQNREFSGLWTLFRHGFLFDLKIVSAITLPIFILPLLIFFWHEGYLGKFWPICRRIYGYVLITLTVLLSVIDFVYFEEYNDQFNWWVLNFLFDDKIAIFRTIWIDYPVIKMALIAGFISGIFCYLYIRLDRCECSCLRTLCSVNGCGKLAMAIVFIIGFVFALRGTCTRRPLQVLDAAITGDVFLNKLVINPAYALYHLLFRNYDRKNLAELIKKGLDAEHVKKSMKFLFGDKIDTNSIDAVLERQTSGFQLNPKPKHVFMVVAESMDIWPFLDKYKHIDLVNDLRSIAENGLFARTFLPAADMTVHAVSSQICNFQYSGLYTNHMPECQKELPYSVGSAFSRLGYETNFFYGGYMSWQNIGNFAASNGFKHVYGGDVMGELTGHEWGIDDDGLFNFVIKKINNDTPSFNLILNTSNHPPYEVDMDSKGVPRKAVMGVTTDNKKIKQLRHVWYANNCIANFIKKADESFDNCLFIITGDHFSRRHLYDLSPFYEKSCVPLIIYGKNYLSQLKLDFSPVGSHVDIPPTMIELCADSGFAYYAFGKNIFNKNSIGEGYGADAVVFSDGICSLNDGSLREIPDVPLGDYADYKIDDAIKRQKAWIELSQWRILFGDKVEPALIEN